MEHGDLDLGATKDEKPPQSELGRLLVDPVNHAALTTLRSRISDQAEGNISLALLRLNNVHQLQSLDSIISPLADVLPANIVSFFNAGIQCIEEQPGALRDLGLKVIAAVAQYDYHTGIGYESLEKLLRNSSQVSASRQPTRAQPAPCTGSATATRMEAGLTGIHVPHRSLEELLHSTRGFIIIGPLGNRPLKTYSQAFYVYVQENYNESLVRARERLDFDSVTVNRECGLAQLS